MKLLLWFAICMLVVAWFSRGKKSPAPAASSRNAGNTSNAEAMVQCAYCKVHVPVSESVAASSGAAFCSEDHRRLGDLRS